MIKPPMPVTTEDVTRIMAMHNEEIAEAIGIICHAIAKHIPEPDALVDDLIAVSEPDRDNSPPMALFFRRFNAVMKGGIEPSSH